MATTTGHASAGALLERLGVEKRLVNLGELVKTQMPVMAIVRFDQIDGCEFMSISGR